MNFLRSATTSGTVIAGTACKIMMGTADCVMGSTTNIGVQFLVMGHAHDP